MGKEVVSSGHQPNLCQKETSLYWMTHGTTYQYSPDIHAPCRAWSVSKPDKNTENNLHQLPWTPRGTAAAELSSRHVRYTGLKECDQHGRSDGEKSCVITHACERPSPTKCQVGSQWPLFPARGIGPAEDVHNCLGSFRHYIPGGLSNHLRSRPTDSSANPHKSDWHCSLANETVQTARSPAVSRHDAGLACLTLPGPTS